MHRVVSEASLTGRRARLRCHHPSRGDPNAARDSVTSNLSSVLAFGDPHSPFYFILTLHHTAVARTRWPLYAPFRRAFPDPSFGDVRLVLKSISSTADGVTDRRIVEAAGGDSRIVVINEVLDSATMAGLMEYASYFVSLHRSEGFGRGLAEAIARGKPVIGLATRETLTL